MPGWDTGFINPLAVDYCVVGGSIPPIPTNTYVLRLDLLRRGSTFIFANVNFLSNSTGPFLTQCWSAALRITILNDGRKDFRQDSALTLQLAPDQFAIMVGVSR